MLEIDGNYGEGGGQIVRTALALSTLTGTPIRVFDIRKGRSQPGLKKQHLKSIETLKELCGAETNEIEVGSTELVYKPGKMNVKDLEIDIETAGSISLYLQPLLLPLFFGDDTCTLKIKGGTTGKWAMPVEYFNDIYLPHIKKYAKDMKLKLSKRGYFPKGGGEVEFKISPKYKLYKFNDFGELRKKVMEEVVKIKLIDRGELSHISGISHASKSLSGKEVAERQAQSAQFHLKSLGVPVKIRVEYSDTLCAGTGIELVAHFVDEKYKEVDENNPVLIGADELGELRVSAEDVGKKAALKLKEELSYGAPVDSVLADNLVPWLIFGGKFKASKITEHTQTNNWVVNQFFPSLIKVQGDLIWVD